MIRFLVCALIAVGFPAMGSAALRLEAEEGRLFGVTSATTRAGYSGRGYVTGFDEDGDRIEIRFKAEAGLYELRLGYAAPHGKKEYEVRVNEEAGGGMFPKKSETFRERLAGKFLLRDGDNVIVIHGGWGWYEIDYVSISPATVTPPVKPSKKLADPNAGPAATRLMSYLVDNYGKKTLSGQYEFKDIDYIREVCGKSPAVGGFDLMEYSPSRIEREADPKGLVEKVVAWARSNDGIVLLTWHWNAPVDLIDEKGGKEWWRGFYTEATTFDIAAALDDESSERYRLLIRDMDVAAAELKKFQAADIPVLWRPLHEAQGGWFWWGAKGSEPCVKLWKIMFDRFTNHHGLHNLIWVYGPPAQGIEATDWYPGDEFVDIVGVSVYADRSSSMNGEWEALKRLYDGRKLIALAESGFPPDPEKSRQFETWWSWFAVWEGKFIRETPDAVIRSVYGDRDVITLDELP